MSDQKNSLAYLQQQLRQAQISAFDYKDLTKKREEIEHYELELQKKYHEENFKHLPMAGITSENEKALKLIKRKKQEVDNLLDTIGEDIFEKIEYYREELLLEIFDQYPGQELIYRKKLNHLTIIDNAIEKISSAQKLCQHIYDELSKIESIRQNIRRKGIFSYIFGINPNIAITQHLKSIETLIKEALPVFQNQNEFEGLETFLNVLHEKSKARWGFRKIDATVESALAENSKILSIIEELKSQKDFEKQKVLASIEKFINSENMDLGKSE